MDDIAINIVPTDTRVIPGWDPLKIRLSRCYIYPQKTILAGETLKKLYLHCHITRAHNVLTKLRKTVIVVGTTVVIIPNINQVLRRQLSQSILARCQIIRAY
jgi:hypothetical protein